MKSKFEALYEKIMLRAAEHPASSNISIGALEKSTRKLASKIESLGLKCEVDVFRTGRGGNEHYGPSYVRLQVIGEIPNSNGEEASSEVKFIADGYGGVLPYEFGGSSWKSLSARGLSRIVAELQRQGWRPSL